VRGHSFLVRASAYVGARQSLLVMSFSEISALKRHAGLEHAFLHEINNVAEALSATVELLTVAPRTEIDVLVNDLRELSRRLSGELLLQKLLLSENPAQYRQNWQRVRLSDTLAFLHRLFANHAVAASKEFVIEHSLDPDEITTDPALAARVLTNMVTNAFEASSVGQRVKVTATSNSGSVNIAVWNLAWMDAAVASRVFQRFFTTKKGPGRGQGTYAMKLIGERLLHGKVEFTTSRDIGTTFSLTLPLDPKHAR
jgi:signal transduction histidine kinase